jgi:hypothetical protein
MRKRFFTMLSLLAVGLTSIYSAPFNLSTFEGDVPAGCKIDTIDGVPYIKVPIDGWNTSFDIVPINIKEGTKLVFSYKYDKDTITDPTIVQAFFQLVNKDWSVKTNFLTDKPASESIKAVKVVVKDTGTYSKLQLAVQKTSGGWSAITGPFLYISKVKVVDPFDIRTFEGPAPEGTVFDTINGKVYLRVVLNGWNSAFDVKQFSVRRKFKATVDVKYSLCKATSDTLDVSNINAVVQLMDTINKVPNQWGPGMVPSATGLTKSPVANTFATVSGVLDSHMKLVNQIQFFGQEKIKWTPTFGDTIWISPVTITSDNPIVLDPEDVDVSQLPSWMKVVTIDNAKYFQVVLNGWNSTINIVPLTLSKGMSAKTKIKYSRCGATADTLTMNQIKAAVQLMDTVDKVKNPWGEGMVPSSTALAQDPASATFGNVSAKLDTNMHIINQIQFFGQQKVSWGATVGDTLWFGKVTLDLDKPSVPSGLTYTLVKDSSIVRLTWKASTDNDAVKEYIITQNGTTLHSLTILVDSIPITKAKYTFGVSAIDYSDNKSDEATVVVDLTSIKNASVTSFSLYPNPVGDVLNIRSSETIYSVTIYNIAGQAARILTINSNNATINMEGLNSGIYLVKVNTAKGVSTQRIVKR